jgi:hypothetical protein
VIRAKSHIFVLKKIVNLFSLCTQKVHILSSSSNVCHSLVQNKLKNDKHLRTEGVHRICFHIPTIDPDFFPK